MTSMTTLRRTCLGAFLLLGLGLPGKNALAQANETAVPPVSTPASPAPDAAAPAVQDPAAAAPATTVPAPGARRGSVRNQRATLDDRVAVFAKNLELTEPQRIAVKRILEHRQQEMLRIRNSPGPGGNRINEFQALQDNTVTQIRAVLTEEQKKKYDPFIARKRPAPSEPQRSVEDWMKLTAPKPDQK